MEMKELQRFVVGRRKAWGFGAQPPISLAIGAAVEMGEVLSEVRAEYINGNPRKPLDDRSSLNNEMADVLIYLFALAEAAGVDFEAAVMNKTAINDKRFPKKS